MKKILFLLFALTSFLVGIQAQSAEEVVATYLETIGGEENLAKVMSLKSVCTANAQGMEIPVTMYQKAPNKLRMDMVFQGQSITQMSFDGNEGWSTNFMTMKPEKFEAEDSEIMKAQLDFPEPFVHYQQKGYLISKEPEETIEGTDCHVLKLTRKPVMVDGKEEENVVYYYFDKETSVPLMNKEFGLKGPQKGVAVETYFGDYQEVNGLYFPHSITQKYEGQTVYHVKVNSTELNVEIAEDFFSMPPATTESDK